ncbi:MAG: adenylate/guanylate cyclase domain-containing protein [Actinomycetota bacterium]
MAGSMQQTNAFLFTDVVGSMRLWDHNAAAMGEALEQHDAVLAEIFKTHGGTIFAHGGDGFGAVFPNASEAMAAGEALRVALREREWPGGLDLAVRCGVHVGQAQRRDGNWFGQAVNLAARVCGAANGGQVLATEEVAEAVPTAELLRLGTFELRGVSDKRTLYQLGLRDHFPAPHSVDPSRDTLPEPANALIGRDAELGSIRRMLEQHRLVTIAGTGGMGKTRLAIEIAHTMAPQFTDGVYFADLSSASDDESMITQVAAAVRLELLSGELREQAVSQVANRTALLVLDNCEHLVGAAARFVSEVLSRPGPGRVLVTSRERLGVAGENQFRLGNLSLDDEVGLNDCARLFLDRAIAIDPSFEVDDQDALGEIVRSLDGLPLAIELAAARTSILSVGEIRDRLDDRLALLTSPRSEAGRTLATMLDWSWQLLDDDERRYLALASVFEGSFDAELLAGVGDGDIYAALDVVESLVDKSLLSVEGRLGSRTRYHLLESIKVYAQARAAELDLGPVDESLQRVLVERFAHDAEPFESSPNLPNHVLAGDLATAMALHQRLWARGECESAAALAVPASSVLLSVGRAAEARSMLADILDHPAISEKLQSRASVGLGIGAIQMDDFGAAIALAERLTDQQDPWIRSCALGLHAVPGLFDGNPETEAYVEASLAAAAEVDRPGAFVALIAGFHRFSHMDMAGAAAAMAPGVPEDQAPMSVLQVMAACGRATALTLADRFAEAEATLDKLIPDDSVWDSSNLLRAMIAMRSGRLDEAEAQLLVVADTALLGRLSREANDVLIGFAALRAAEGARAEAEELLIKALLPRSVQMFAFAAHVAIELDALEALLIRSQELRAEQGPTRLEARDALQAELDRRRSG